MTQNASKTNACALPVQSRPVLRRISQALAGGTCAFALSLPLAGESALAQDWQVTERYYSGGSSWTYRMVNPEFGGIQQMRGSAPGNNCPVPAFEIVNPKPGEVRCVGYVAPW